ncbi:hypothetical protein SAMN05660284_02634 [Formivibrio citricus]|uniref:YD repeat-containing protein n=1 Tax=Formivibrio citricus TaxID=83765 RepID=A0A1I5DDH7_9NEIS|nr:hypothetical protein [Formivibrio citricus]SFN97253.1 hypothetical protein SAMN05660284_02634 [Formivibrio citricus]
MNPRLLFFLLLLLVALPSSAEWGRLFYSPAERTELDRNATPLTHRFDGEARNSRGRTLRWVDGQLNASSPPTKVKPGERWDPRTGEVHPDRQRSTTP